MSDIFEEVDEEVRRDKAAELWAKYQILVYVAAALIVIATGGYRFYQYHETQVRESAGAAFQEALKLEREGKPADAQAALAQLAKQAPGGYRTLARFAAAAEAQKTDAKAGAAAFDEIANDSSADAAYRDAARLRAALARLDAGEADAAKGVLESLATPTGAYRHVARLTLGSIALQQNDYAGAGKQLDAVVSDPEAPQTERRAADALLGVVASHTSK